MKGGWRTTVSFQWESQPFFLCKLYIYPAIPNVRYQVPAGVCHPQIVIAALSRNSGHRELPSVELVPRYLKEKDYVRVIVTSSSIIFAKTCVLVVSSLWTLRGNTTLGVVINSFSCYPDLTSLSPNGKMYLPLMSETNRRLCKIFLICTVLCFNKFV